MRERYIQKLEQMNLSLYKMCAKVINQINNSVEALFQGNSSLANDVCNQDIIIDEMEKDIENQCLQILLREQPVAKDFRRVSAILKMITDIERIGDHAEDIASLVLTLDDKNVRNIVVIKDMCRIAKDMLDKSVEGYIKEDMELCDRVVEKDDKLDKLFQMAKKELARHLDTDNMSNDDVVSLLMIAKYLERIGDHAVNISEWAKYYEYGVRS